MRKVVPVFVAASLLVLAGTVSAYTNSGGALACSVRGTRRAVCNSERYE